MLFVFAVVTPVRPHQDGVDLFGIHHANLVPHRFDHGSDAEVFDAAPFSSAGWLPFRMHPFKRRPGKELNPLLPRAKGDQDAEGLKERIPASHNARTRLPVESIGWRNKFRAEEVC